MTLRHLNIFSAVCDYGTMTKAAEELHIAQPAVSATIAELEKYYGIQLFDRINQRLVITDAGKELLLKAKAVLSAFSDFEALANKEYEDPAVHIGSTLTIGTTFIPKLLTEIHSLFPSIQPQVKITNALEIEEGLMSGEIDFGLIEGEVSSPSLTKVLFAKDRLVVICGKSYSIPESVSVAELALHPFLIREKGSASRDLLEHVLTEKRVSCHAVIESQCNEAILAATRENLGVAALPFGIVEAYLQNGYLREVHVNDISLERPLYLVKRKSKHFSKAQESAFVLSNKIIHE